MDTSTLPPQLLEQDATRVVQSACERAIRKPSTFTHSYGSENYVLSCDAMLFTLDAGSGSDGQLDSYLHLCYAALDREAVELCHAVSCCKGYSFRENRSFWLHALSPDSDSAAVLGVGEIAYDFPPIVFAWKGRSPSSTESLVGYCCAFFDISPTHFAKTEEFCGDMKMLEAFMLPERKAKSIEVTIDLFGVTFSNSHIPEVMWLLFEIPTALTATATGREKMRLKLARVRFNQSSMQDKQTVDLLVQLPSTIDLRLTDTPGYHWTSPDSLLLFQLRMGMKDTEFSGRLREVDLMHCSRGVMAAVCSLLPFSLSIETVAASVGTLEDWLWLGYAMFHPESHNSSWRTLKLTATGSCTSDLAVFCACHKARLWSVIPAAHSQYSPSASEALRNRLNDASQDSSGRLIKSTTIRAPTAVISLYTTSDDQQLTIAQGSRVELCDPSWSPRLPSLEHVPVIVAGYGAGTMLASSLAMEQTTARPASSTSCITTLEVSGLKSGLVQQLARVMAPRIQRLTVRGPPEEFPLTDVVHLPPTLTTVQGYAITARSAGVDFSALLWSRFQSMEIVCKWLYDAERVVDAMIAAKATPKFLRLQVRCDSRVSWPYSTYSSLQSKLGELMTTSRTLASLYIWMEIGSELYAEGFPMWPRVRSTRRAKLAFLDAASHPQTSARGSAVGLLGADEISLVFAYVGHSPDFFLVHDASSRVLFYDGKMYRTKTQLG